MSDDSSAEAHKLAYAMESSAYLERIKSQVDLAQGIVRTLVLINGGAIVALYTIIGAKLGQLNMSSPDIWAAFWLFIGGIICSVIAACGGFVSQFNYGEASLHRARANLAKLEPNPSRLDDPAVPYRTGNCSLWAGIIAAGGSLGLFAAGSYFALRGVLAFAG